MTVQITVIGTGQIGASIGLALGEHKDMILRVGHDKDFRAASRAKDMGAFERVENNLHKAVAGAAVVILALPLDQIRETFKLINLDLQDEAIVMDTAPVKSEVLQWAEALLPRRRYYIGLTPVINPVYLDTPGSGVESAHADLFKNGLMAVVSPSGVPEEAIKLATDFAHMLGAGHLFMDPAEVDSMMAATHILPQIIAAALVNTAVNQPGWYEARKLAGRPFNAVTNSVQLSDPESLSAQAISASEHLARWMDNLIEYLTSFRQTIASKDAEKLMDDLTRAQQGHEKWLVERKAADWVASETGSNVKVPSARDLFIGMFTFGGAQKPKKGK